MIAYKLLRQYADGSLGSLFIARKERFPLNTKLHATSHPTKGYALRPGFHCVTTPSAPHLSTDKRVWAKCQIDGPSVTPIMLNYFVTRQQNDPSQPHFDCWYHFKRPAHQSGFWIIASNLTILELLPIESTSALSQPSV